MAIVATVTPAARRSLTTPSRYRDAMPAADISDEELERLIGRCTSIIERYCGRTSFARERVVEETTGSGLSVLLLARTPIVAIHDVTVGDSTIASTLYSLTAHENGLLRLSPNLSHEWLWEELGMPQMYDRPARRGLTLYRVEYTGGWVVPETPGLEDQADLPGDLEHACMILVRGEIEARERSVGLSSERLGDAGWTYAAVPGPLGMGHAKPILDHYRVPVL